MPPSCRPPPPPAAGRDLPTDRGPPLLCGHRVVCHTHTHTARVFVGCGRRIVGDSFAPLRVAAAEPPSPSAARRAPKPTLEGPSRDRVVGYRGRGPAPRRRGGRGGGRRARRVRSHFAIAFSSAHGLDSAHQQQGLPSAARARSFVRGLTRAGSQTVVAPGRHAFLVALSLARSAIAAECGRGPCMSCCASHSTCLLKWVGRRSRPGYPGLRWPDCRSREAECGIHSSHVQASNAGHLRHSQRPHYARARGAAHKACVSPGWASARSMLE